MKRLRRIGWIRRLWVKWDAYQTRRQLEWERLHVVRHPDGNTSVHGASMRAVLRWYNRQHWPHDPDRFGALYAKRNRPPTC